MALEPAISDGLEPAMRDALDATGDALAAEWRAWRAERDRLTGEAAVLTAWRAHLLARTRRAGRLVGLGAPPRARARAYPSPHPPRLTRGVV